MILSQEDTQKKCTSNTRRLDSRKYFYSQRVITPWNKLSQKTVIAESVNALKNNLDASYGTNSTGDHISHHKTSFS